MFSIDWIRTNGRCCHEIAYPSGHVDRIEFQVYDPEEICTLTREAGLRPKDPMVWWDAARRPTAGCARYQVLCECA